MTCICLRSHKVSLHPKLELKTIGWKVHNLNSLKEFMEFPSLMKSIRSIQGKKESRILCPWLQLLLYECLILALKLSTVQRNDCWCTCFVVAASRRSCVNTSEAVTKLAAADSKYSTNKGESNAKYL